MAQSSRDARFARYEHLLDHSRYANWDEHHRQWGWEFLRRRDDYRDDWINGRHTVAERWGLSALVDPDSNDAPEFRFPQHWHRIFHTKDLDLVDPTESNKNFKDARAPQYRRESWRNALLARDLQCEGWIERKIGKILEPDHSGGPTGARDKGRDSIRRFERLSQSYLKIAFGLR
jgi:hypothetical protein